MKSYTVTTNLTTEQVRQSISEIAKVLGLSTFPLNDRAYQEREGMTVIAEISSDHHRSGGKYAWIVGYQDVSRTTANVRVFPHEWASFDLGTQAVYDEFVRLVVERLTPGQSEQPAQAMPPPPAAKQAAGERGITLGTAERVNEFHRLVKSCYSHREAKKLSRCDPSTYYQWCKEVTGEDPIEPYR